MKRLLLAIGLIAVLGTGRRVRADDVETWTAKNGTSGVVFLANASFHLKVTYTMLNGTNTTRHMHLSHAAGFNMTATSNNDSVVVLTIADKENTAKIHMAFYNNTKSYFLGRLDAFFVINNKTFYQPDKEGNVTATMTKAKQVFMTTLGKSYQCSLETELELDASNQRHTYIRVGGVQLEAFKNSTNFSNASLCFTDQPHMSQNKMWEIKGKKDTICARIQTKASVQVTYKQISGKVHTTTIPFTNDTTATGMCNDTDASISFSLDNDTGVNLMMNFNRYTPKIFGATPGTDYQLTGVTLSYSTSNRYFPNSPIVSNKGVIANSSLSLYTTPVKQSYKCTVDDQFTVDKDKMLTMFLSDTQWQVFELPTKGFNNASECPAMVPPSPDPAQPPIYDWEVKEGNKTCFRAKAGFQFKVSYQKEGEKDMTDTQFDFFNTSKRSAANCTNNTMFVSIVAKERNQSLKLAFTKVENKTEYALTKVDLMFEMLNTTFLNASVMNKMVSVTSLPNIMLMRTKLNNSYSCSMETQVQLTGNESKVDVSDVFLRVVDIKNFQAFVPEGQKTPVMSKCYHDKKAMPATQGDWKIKDGNETCGRVKSMFTLTVSYLDIADKTQFVTIPIDGANVKMLNGSCSNDTTELTLDVDQNKMINLTLVYKKVKPAYTGFAAADSMDYVLDNVTLNYRSDSWYFPNHKDYGNVVTISQSGLMAFRTTVGMSYRCDLPQDHVITNVTSLHGLTLSLNQTHWEAFGMNTTNNGSFSTARLCAAEQTTAPPHTTPPVTPRPPHIPTDPTPEKFVVKSEKDNRTCFLADIGLQMRTTYNMTNQTSVKIGFNFIGNKTTVTAMCNETNSTVTFYRKDIQQRISLHFYRDTTMNVTYLRGIDVGYQLNSSYFPMLDKKTNATVKNSLDKLELTKAKLNHSYSCTEETDILIAPANNTLVRIVGVKLQAFDVVKDSYSTVSPCFTDQVLNNTGTGNWTIMSNKTACARYMFAATANISYPTLLGSTKTISIPVASESKNYNGDCGKNISYFWVQMDDLIFTYLFNKTAVGDTFNYEMFDVHVEYNTTSKYFPNHAYDVDHRVALGNNSISLFESSSGHSYKCAASTSIMFNDTVSTMEFKNVQVQPFGIEKSGGFSEADDCAPDDLSPIIPIVVGSVLALLIVLVLVAYIIGRKKASKVEYETI